MPITDGLDLKADRYWAAGCSGDPLVLMRTPYGRSGLWSMVARSMAQRGVQVLITVGDEGMVPPLLETIRRHAGRLVSLVPHKRSLEDLFLKEVGAGRV